MLFTPDFIAQIRRNPAAGVLKACAIANAKLDSRQGWDAESFEILGETYAVVSALIESGLLQVEVPEPPQLTDRLRDNCVALQQYLLQVRRGCVVKAQWERLDQIRRRTFESLERAAGDPEPAAYRFTPDDLEAIRAALARLQALVSQHALLDLRIRLRTERRLQQLQDSLNESMASFDLFWGLVGELKMVMQSVPQDARSVVQCLAEVSALAGEAHTRALEEPPASATARIEGPPAGTPWDASSALT